LKAVKTAVTAALLAAMVVCMCVVNNMATQKVFASEPSWYFLSPHSYKKFNQILGVSFGYRAMLSDFEYISFLQYYGDRSNADARFKDLLARIDDITDADPHFTFAYTYGSAILAFNLKRYDEAITVIKKGLDYNPQFWKLRFYLGAIIYMQKGDTKQYVRLLEEALKFDDHPAMIERLLGNIYETYKTPDECAAYWAQIYKNTKDKDTRKHAKERLLLLISSKKISDPERILQQ
jgi:tetratricopeptide (TPR) repeat protein